MIFVYIKVIFSGFVAIEMLIFYDVRIPMLDLRGLKNCMILFRTFYFHLSTMIWRKGIV